VSAGPSNVPRLEVSLTDSSAQPPAVLVSTDPIRVLDTRPGTGPIGVPTATKLGAGQQLDLKLAGEGLVIPATATAAILNITIDSDASLQSFLTVWPSGQPRPTTSANNALPGLVAANSIIAKLGNGSISIFNQQGSVNVVIDLVGYLVPLKGAAGAGTTILNGSGAPASSLGSDGDFYLDTTGNILYGPRAGGLWTGIALGTTNVSIDGDGILGLPLVVLGSTAWTTIGTFTAPAAGDYLLQANIGVEFQSTGGPVAAGVGSTTNCRWSNNTALELGASITAGVTIDLVVDVIVPGLDTSNIGLPGSVQDAVVGTTVDLQCQVDTLLAVGSRTELSGAFTATHVNFIS
ncbi:MAG: hypothetical protein ABIR32_22870, partial [Ilumatobacteraceae bacterium]